MFFTNIQYVSFHEKISTVVEGLNLIRDQIEYSHLAMENKYKTLFHKCVQAQGDKHSAAAMLFANECAKVRKMAKAIMVSQLTLERLVFNLDTIQDYWDAVAEFKPMRSTLQVLSGRLADFLPETAQQLKQLGETLANITNEFDNGLA